MFVFIFLLLIVEGIRQDVTCKTIGLNPDADLNEYANTKYRRDDNSILDELSSRVARPSSLRSRRDSEPSNTEASPRSAYEKEINQTISDYQAQRKAVMDRYYARQREIVEKFSRRTTSRPRSNFDRYGLNSTISGNRTTVTRDAHSQNKTVTNEVDIKKNLENVTNSLTNLGKTDRAENRTSSTSWIYRSSNWNPRIPDNSSDIDLQPESLNTLERSADSRDDGSYYKLGDFTKRKDEKIVYQHNLGVGVKGSSQLDATFKVVIEGPYSITVVEAFPYANTRANLTWISGGPGFDYVKLKLQGYENQGFSYTVKVWGVPKKTKQENN